MSKYPYSQNESTFAKRTRSREPSSIGLRSTTSLSPATSMQSFSQDSSRSSVPAPQRRRVNPTSLANKLGPELIRELESLLSPGSTEMPSFAERQAIQKKFNIDRRHIYDWYHTKGLRVSTKERTPAQQKPEPEKHDENNQRPRQQRKLMPGGASPPRSASIPSEDSLDSSVSTPASTPTMPQTPPTLNPYAPLGPMEGESCTGFPIEYFLEPPLPGATTANLNSPAFSDEDIKRPFSDLQLSPYDWPNESFPLNSPLLEQEAIPPYPLYYEQPLPREQREAYYQCLAEAVGPAIGVQESVGTYRTYMSQLGQRYYDRQFPQPNSAPTPTAVPEIHPQAILQYLSRGNHPTDQPRHISQRRESVDSSRPLSPKSAMEYHKWINNRVQTTSHIPSPAGPPVPTPGNHPHRAEDHGFWSQFQSSQNQDVESSNSLRLNDILESPVLRSRNSSCNVGNPGEGDILQYPGPAQMFYGYPLHLPSSSVTTGKPPIRYAPIDGPQTFSVSLRSKKHSDEVPDSKSSNAERENKAASDADAQAE